MGSYDRSPWSDRFNTPSVTELRKGLDSVRSRLFDAARRRFERLDKLGDVEERLAWYGDGWQWTVEWRLEGADEPLVVLVPGPEDIQLAAPLERDFLDNLPTKSLKRSIRDGLRLAQAPFDTSWGVWLIQTTSQLDDLQKLIERKLDHLVKDVA